MEQGLSFYSERCDAGKVRSCARPTCLKIDPYPQKCIDKMAAMSGAQLTAQTSIPARHVASAPVPGPKVGAVEGLVGSCWKVQGATRVPLDIGSLVNEKDTLQTGQAGRVEIVFDDGNRIVLSENTTVLLSKVLITPEEEKRRTILNLLRGKVRSRVQKQKKQTSTDDFKFKVQTPSAVAGVRGTDFVVEYNEDVAQDESRTRVSTFNGLVDLRGTDRVDKALIGANQTGAFVERGLEARMSGQNFLQKAFLTPVRSMTKEESQGLDAVTVVAARTAASASAKRGIASVDMTSTCEAPKADFNQCSWTCRNNPVGESICRTDIPGVECLRSVCKADGQWHDQTRLPASFGHYCDPAKSVVAPCDY